MLIWLGIDYESNQAGKLRWICLCIFIYIYLYLLYIFRSSSMWCNLIHLPCNPIILGTWLSCKTDCSFDGLDTTGTTAAIPSWILIQMHTSSNFGDNEWRYSRSFARNCSWARPRILRNAWWWWGRFFLFSVVWSPNINLNIPHLELSRICRFKCKEYNPFCVLPSGFNRNGFPALFQKNPSHDLLLNFDDFSMSIEAVWKTYRTFWCRNMALKIQPEKSNLRGHSSDPLLLPREPVLQLIESLRCRANSWGNGEILERWTHAQHWSD